MDAVWRHVADAAVAALVVAPSKAGLTVRSCVLDTAQALGEFRPVLHGLGLRLRVRVVFRELRAFAQQRGVHGRRRGVGKAVAVQGAQQRLLLLGVQGQGRARPGAGTAGVRAAAVAPPGCGGANLPAGGDATGHGHAQAAGHLGAALTPDGRFIASGNLADKAILNKSSRVWAPWFGMGCKAKTTAIAPLWRGFATPQTAQNRADRAARTCSALPLFQGPPNIDGRRAALRAGRGGGGGGGGESFFCVDRNRPRSGCVCPGVWTSRTLIHHRPTCQCSPALHRSPP